MQDVIYIYLKKLTRNRKIWKYFKYKIYEKINS